MPQSAQGLLLMSALQTLFLLYLCSESHLVFLCQKKSFVRFLRSHHAVKGFRPIVVVQKVTVEEASELVSLVGDQLGEVDRAGVGAKVIQVDNCDREKR